MSDKRYFKATPARELLKDKRRLDYLERLLGSADSFTIQNFVQGLKAYTDKRDSTFHPTVRELLDSIMKDGSFY